MLGKSESNGHRVLIRSVFVLSIMIPILLLSLLTMTTSQTEGNLSPLVLVTGASGFIAKHTIHQLLEAGYCVRGTVLNEKEAEIARNAFAMTTPSSNFSLHTADLTSDRGWEEAVRGCDYVIHLASPYPLVPPSHREALVPMARDGTLRVVKNALGEASVKRIVITSSTVAMQYQKVRTCPVAHLTEDSWTDPEWKAVPAYPLSKTLAERAVWDLACTNQEAKERIVVVNPGMVWGPMYDEMLSTSSEICKLIMTGAYPLIPCSGYPIVDVRDVAKVLVACLAKENKDVCGHRLIASSDTLAFQEIAEILAKAFPKYARSLPTRTMPHWLLYLASFLDKALEMPLLDAYTTTLCDTKYVTDLTGVTFRPAEEAIRAMAQSLIDNQILD